MVLGKVSLVTSSALLYNNIATQYNNGTLNITATNIIDGAIYVGSAINPFFSAISAWFNTVPNLVINKKK